MATSKKARKPSGQDPDGLAAALERGEHFGRESGVRCTVAIRLDEMPDDLRAQVETALNSQALNSARLANLLTGYGYQISPANIRRHRKRGTSSGCLCSSDS
jgi:hypothetical protein